MKMGMNCTIYGHTFRVINADPFTKWFYEQAGWDIGTEEEQPLDNYLETLIWKRENTTFKTGLPKDCMESLYKNEKVMGGTKPANFRLKQFLENDRKVLRFYGYWDDTSRYGRRHYFMVHYFLADDTV